MWEDTYMKEKMMGSYYPKCNSTNRSFAKHGDVNGTIRIEDGNLYFDAKVLMMLSSSKNSFMIPLRDIDHVETMNLNGVMPFGVCLFLKDGTECMLGNMRNKKLADFINEAIVNY